MGTYTANKNLYMPSVGETGWGTLMNTNLSTIDNFLKPITVSGSTYTFTGNHVGNQSGGSISATSITNSGTLTNTGKITGNGGIAGTTGTFSGAVTSKNISSAGFIPFTILLYGTVPTIYGNVGVPFYMSNIGAGAYTQLVLFNRIAGSMTANTTYTYNAYPFIYYPNAGGAYIVNDWQIKSGSWSIGICTDITGSTTISNKNVTISNITNTPKTVSVSDIVKLVNGGNTTLKVTPTSNVGSNGISIYVRFTNTSSSSQNATSIPSGWI